MTPEEELPQKLKCGHTMDAWFFRDEESGHGECAVCALPKLEAENERLWAFVDQVHSRHEFDDRCPRCAKLVGMDECTCSPGCGCSPNCNCKVHR